MFDPPLRYVKGKVALITGGSSGIGLGIARACFAAGMRVIVTYLTERHLAEASKHFADRPEDFHAIRLEVADREAMARAADEAESVFGEVNLLCNNAGVGIHTPITSATYDDWDYALATNVYGVVNGVQTFVPRMIARSTAAHIVSTASMSGLIHGGHAGIYTTTKFAVVGMMEALRAELAPRGIGVSAFCPGLVRSRIYLHERNRRSRDAAPARFIEERAVRRIESIMSTGMAAYECGQKVLRGVRRNDMYILTHPEFEAGIQQRWDVLKASLPTDDPVPPERLRSEEAVVQHEVYATEKARLERGHHKPDATVLRRRSC